MIKGFRRFKKFNRFKKFESLKGFAGKFEQFQLFKRLEPLKLLNLSCHIHRSFLPDNCHLDLAREGHFCLYFLGYFERKLF